MKRIFMILICRRARRRGALTIKSMYIVILFVQFGDCSI
jgi:hypothetical protein